LAQGKQSWPSKTD